MDDIKAALRMEPQVKAAWLFGSAAADRLRPDSDLDVAILGEQALDAPSKLQLIEALARVCGRPVDLVDLQAERGLIVGQVLKHGRRLFCDDTTLYAELMKRWMFYDADYLPYYRRILKERRERWIGP